MLPGTTVPIVVVVVAVITGLIGYILDRSG